MAEPVLLSISRCNTYKKCPRSFRYRYIDEFPVGETIESLNGGFFHKVLDCWAKIFKETGVVRDAMIDAYRVALYMRDEQNKDDKRSYSEKILKQDRGKVKDWLKKIIEALEVDPPNIIAHELKFKFLLQGRFLVRGYIDRIDQYSENTLKIVDYKTGKSRYVNDKQVSVYGKALINEPFYRDQKIIGSYLCVNEDNKDMRYDITTARIDKTLKYLIDIGEQIIADTSWKAKYSPLCGWCSYKFRCQKESNLGAW